MHKTVLSKILAAILVLLCSSPLYAFERDITVLLFNTSQPVSISGNEIVIDSIQQGLRLRGTCRVFPENNRINISGHSFNSEVKIRSDSPVTVNNKKYYGYILIQNKSGTLSVKNIVNSERYLESVVKSEMSPSWPVEALKAQAVLARTYILSSGKHGNECDLCATTHCQVYNGIVPVSENVKSAVSQTRGQILKYNNAPAKVFYHADSGGIVTSSENVWGRDVPYLRTVFEPVKSVNPNSFWSMTINKTSLESKLSSAGINVGKFMFFKPLKRDNSGRVKELLVQGNAGAVNISGSKLRNILGPVMLKSTLFDFSDFSRASYMADSDKIFQNDLQKDEQNYAEQSPAVSENTEKSPSSSSGMTEDDLVKMTKEGYFSMEELMYMLSTPDKMNEHAEFAEQRKKFGRKFRQKNMSGSYAKLPQYKKSTKRYKVTDVKAFSMERSDPNSDSVTFFGLGYGHGVGMSQWGARSLAENGWNYREILDLYFKGTLIAE